VGINVNLTADQFPTELRTIATSLRRSSRKKVDRVELLRLFLHRLEKRYEQYHRDGLRPMHKLVRGYSSLIGHEVTLSSGRKQTKGIARDIDLSGSLILETSDGTIAVTSGEVTVAKDPK
jgi:BirA family biotin operon repressor/biotin-[acetyl-CoA-carboxylase] ligase